MKSAESQPNYRPIGILGDGQLALMLGEAAERRGYDFYAFGDDPASSFAQQFPDLHVQGSVHAGNVSTLARAPSKALLNFAKMIRAQNGVLTLENEFIPGDTLKQLAQETGVAIIPDPDSYQYFQDKISQRTLYERLEIPGPKWVALKSAQTKPDAPFTYPFVVKAAAGGYDGYGVRIVNNETEFNEALKIFKFAEGSKILVEEKVEIVREFAQGVLLDGKGGAVFLPLVETIQRSGTCVLTLSKTTLSTEQLNAVTEKVQTALQQLARSTLNGLFNFEFFYTAYGEVLINEGAPRPHNSQHLTIDASPVSQFRLLMQYLAEGEIRQDLKAQATIPIQNAIMINLLGKSTGQNYQLKLPATPSGIEVHPKLYLKKECRPGRKMGHLNLVDRSGKLDAQALQELGEKILKEYEL